MADWDGGLYHRVASPQFEWGLQVLARLKLNGDERILDAGCGSGRLTQELVNRVPQGRVVGLDLSSSMAKEAWAHLERGADIIRGDLLSLPFARCFDVVFSTAAFHWVLDQPRLFSQLHGVLREGGRLHAQCGGGPNVARLHKRAAALMRDEAFSPWFTNWQEPWEFQDEATATGRLEAAGFHHVQAWLEERPTRFADAQEFRDFVSGIVLRPHLAAIGHAEERQAFMDRIVATAARDYPPYTLDYWRLNLEAVA